MIDIDKLFGWLFCWQTGFWLLAIYSMVLLLRRVVENVYKPIRTKIWWGELVLPILPLAIGLGFGFVKTAPYPDGVTTTVAHVVYGFVCGALSSKGYRVLYALVKQKFPEAPMSAPVVDSEITPVEVPANLGSVASKEDATTPDKTT